MFGLGPGEMIIVAVLALLLFGKNLPKVAKDLGKSVKEFQKGLHQIEDDVNRSDYNPRVESSNSSRPAPPDQPVETTAPKFEPPTSEPTSIAAAEASPNAVAMETPAASHS